MAFPEWCGLHRVERRWFKCIFLVRADGKGVQVDALVPEYAQHKLWMTREELYLRPELFDATEKIMGDWLKRAVEAAGKPENAVHFRDEEFEKEYPALYDFLAAKIGPNGKEREGGCLLVYARDNEVTACLKDRGLKKSFYGRSDGLWAALKELEARIRADA